MRGSKLRLPEAAQQQVLALGQQGLGTKRIARELGLTEAAIAATYRRYQRAGLVPRRASVKGPPWTPKDLDTLYQMIDAGYGYDAIARRLKRSRVAVVLKCRRLDYRLLTTRAALTCRQAQTLLGIGCAKTITRWIGMGLLKARNAGMPERPLWRIQWEDLCAFLEEPTNWMAYDPARITEATLREWAQELRAGKPRWLRQGEIAARYGVTVEAVGQWIQKGWLPAVRYGNWWVNEAALVGWVPPCMRDRRTWRAHYAATAD